MPAVNLVLVGIVVLAGAFGAVRVWASDRGLWNDELYIAVNVRDLSPLELFGGLRYFQVAPPGWLVVEKAVLTVLGEGEQALRLVPMLASVATLVLGVVLARRAIGRWASLPTAVLLAASPTLLTYAGEMKQYSTEAAVALLLLLAADAYAAQDRQQVPRRRRVAVWIAVGVVGALVSYSAMVVIVAVIAAVSFFFWKESRFADLKIFLLASIPGVVVSAVLVIVRELLPQLDAQNSYFPTGFPPAQSNLVQIVEWLPRMWAGFVVSPLGWAAPVLVLLLVVGGIVSLVLRGRLLWAVLLTLVPVLAICAAAVHGLPMQDRVALYLVAPMVLAIAACLDGLARGAVRAVSGFRTAGFAIGVVVAVGCAAVIAQPAVVGAYEEVGAPRYRDAGRDVMADVASRLEPGDRVIGYYFDKPMVAWYGRQFRLPVVGLTRLGPRDTCDPGSVPAVFAGATRIWYVHGALESSEPADYNARVVGILAEHGHVVESKQVNPLAAGLASPGWTLIDARMGPDSRKSRFVPLAKSSCLSVLPPATF